MGVQVIGEVLRCSHTTLQRMDEYESLSKGHYERSRVQVCLLGRSPHRGATCGTMALSFGAMGQVAKVHAWVYCMRSSPFSLRSLAKKGPSLSEYGLKQHLKEYRPIQHIQVKQQLHLRVSVGTPAKH